MKNVKDQRLLEGKKRRLESNICAAEKFIADMAPEIRAELVKILSVLGVDLLTDNLSIDQSKLSCLTEGQREIFSGFAQVLMGLAEDRYQLDETNLLLKPRLGRGEGSRNKKQKPLEPTIAQALEYRKTPEGRALKLYQLAQKMNPGHHRDYWRKWIHRFKKAQTQENRK
jgi:hypothetical protein